MDLKYAERGRLAKHAPPRFGVELVIATIKRERIRAVWTAKRTAVCQLGQQAKGLE